MTCDDDITLQYIEIVKINNNLASNLCNENKKVKLIQSLIFRIKCLFDNTQEKAKHSNGRPMKGIKKRISGKEGQMRNNCMGKRVNQSGRTVIGPDPTLRLDEMVVPEKIANILTYPEVVNKYNLEKMKKLINDNKVKYILRNNFYINLQYAMFRQGTELLQFNDEQKDVYIIKDNNIYINDTVDSTMQLRTKSRIYNDIKFLKEDLELNKDDERIICYLGIMYFILNDYETSIEYFNQCINKDNNKDVP